MGRRARPAKGKTEAKRSLASESPKNEGAKVRDLEKRLLEALEQQTATSKILKVISSSPTAVQPTFEAIATAAPALCEADFAGLFRFDGERIHFVAEHGWTREEVDAARRAFPQRPGHGSVTARAILTAAVVQVADYSQDPDAPESLRTFRTVLAVPMIQNGRPLGTITAARRVVSPFTERQIALLQTFADQAVIAMENVRLFKELEERHRELTDSLTQQAATAEILRVISSSPTDIQPVLQTIAETAARVCGASDGVAYLTVGMRLRIMAHHGAIGALIGQERDLDRASVSGRAAVDRTPVHVFDLQAETSEFPLGSEVARQFGHRTTLAVPLLRDGAALGALLIRRLAVRPFSDKQVELLKTFADQAVIAVENVRLFTELQQRNADVTAALEQQTATSDILRVISRSQTDVQPVFDAILTSAVRLLGGYSGTLTRLAGDQIDLAALTSIDDAGDAAMRATFPHSLHSERVHGRAIRDRAPLNVADASTDPRLPDVQHANARARGYRPDPRYCRRGRLRESDPPATHRGRPPRAARGAAPQRGRGHRRPGRDPQDVWRVRAGDRPSAQHLRHPVGPGHPERPAVPGDRREGPPVGSREPAQERVPR